MLVLSRKCGEVIVLPEQGVSIRVLEVQRTRVRLGISAPASVPVYRQEVWQQIVQDRQEAAAGAGLPER